MTESAYTTRSGAVVHQHLDADGKLVEQACIRCHEWRRALKFPRRDNAPTGRGLLCYPCKRRERAAYKRAAYAAARAELSLPPES